MTVPPETPIINRPIVDAQHWIAESKINIKQIRFDFVAKATP